MTFILYFIPAIIALIRDKKRKGEIFLWNLLIGWTIIGWVFVLVWSVKQDAPQRVIVVQEED